jgi:cold shock CspA family protein
VRDRTRRVVGRTAPARKVAAARPPEPRGVPGIGRIVTLFIGQGHGFIRLASGRDVFFHRSDVHEGASFNALAVGDRVTFELLEDHVSGPRALRVEPRRPRR